VYVCAHAYTGVCVNVQVCTTNACQLYDVYRVLISVRWKVNKCAGSIVRHFGR
jgi:hypothetical protein